MSFLKRLLGRAEPAVAVDDPDFGHITYSRHDGWMNSSFSLWGTHPVELIIAGDVKGPSDVQRKAFREFQSRREELMPRFISELLEVRRGMDEPGGKFVATGLNVPELAGSEAHSNLWTIWFDCVGDEHFMYGIQSDDNWRSFQGFADD